MQEYFFSPSTYATRRSDLAKAIGSGLILFPSNEEVGINYKDNTYPFRQDSSFLYYSGIDRGGLCLILDAASGECVLMGDELTTDDVIWTGPLPSLHELAQRAGIHKVISISAGLAQIQSAKDKNYKIHYLPIYRGDHAFRLSTILNLPPDQIAVNASTDLCAAVVHQRECKTTEEIDQLVEAINISGEMHLTMMKEAKAGMTESEVMAKVRSVCLEKNVDIPYTIILSVNGQTLHNHSYHNTLKSGQLLLGDFGSESYMHYAGDITRTIPVDKSFTSFQKEIYSIVLNTLETCISKIKAGIKYKDVHLQAAKTITEGMKSLGFLKGNTEEIIAEGAHALFFPHGLGHPLGLDVHDMEGIGENYTGYEEGLVRSTQFGLKSLRLAKTLREGMVITVEPGIYFIPELISAWKSENKFNDFINYAAIEKMVPFGGIRIEDNVYVHKDHGLILGNPIPKSIKEVEQIRELAYK